MFTINRTQYLTELEKMISFMSSADRNYVMNDYRRRFDAAPDENEFIQMLGNPTRQAFELAKDYVPGIAVRAAAEEAAANAARNDTDVALESNTDVYGDSEYDSEYDSDEESAEPVAPIAPITPIEIVETEAGAEVQSLSNSGQAMQAEIGYDDSGEAIEELPVKQKKRKVRPFATIVWVLLSIIIGVPVFAVLVCIGLPFLALGAGVIAGDIWVAVQLIQMLSLISDILLVAGVGLVISAIGVLAAWLGLWISLELGAFWVGKVIFGLGGRVCCRKEARKV